MLVGIFLLINFSLMLILGLPMVFSISTAAVAMLVFFAGQTPLTLPGIAQAVGNALVANNTGITIALFILSGDLMSHGKITDKIFNILAYFLGKKRGFMPLLAIATCMMYGAISGSAPGTTAAVGAMCFPILVRLGYDPVFSAAIIVGGGCLGTVIPPSIQVTGVSVLSGGLDLATLYKVAAVMGVACIVLIMVYAYVYCLRHGNGDQEMINAWVDELRSMGFKKVFFESIWAFLTPLIILGTIFAEIADTAQAAAIAGVYSVLVSIFIYKTIKPNEIWSVITKSLRNSAPMLCMLAFASLLTSTMSTLGVVDVVTDLVQNSGATKGVFIVVVLIMMVLLGTVSATNITVLTPIMYPIVRALGMEPYTAMMAVMLSSTTGAITPPVGNCLFIMQPMANCSVGRLGKQVIPCVVIYILVSAVAFCMPGLFASITAGAVIP